MNLSSFGGVVLILVSLVGAVFWSRWGLLARAAILLAGLIALIVMFIPIVVLERMRTPNRHNERNPSG